MIPLFQLSSTARGTQLVLHSSRSRYAAMPQILHSTVLYRPPRAETSSYAPVPFVAVQYFLLSEPCIRSMSCQLATSCKFLHSAVSTTKSMDGLAYNGTMRTATRQCSLTCFVRIEVHRTVEVSIHCKVNVVTSKYEREVLLQRG